MAENADGESQFSGIFHKITSFKRLIYRAIVDDILETLTSTMEFFLVSGESRTVKTLTIEQKRTNLS